MQPQLEQIVTLTPKTRRGKNALQNKTNAWRVFDVSEHVACVGGPAFGLFEVREDDRQPDCRWIALPVDKNFDWNLVDN